MCYNVVISLTRLFVCASFSTDGVRSFYKAVDKAANCIYVLMLFYSLRASSLALSASPQPMDDNDGNGDFSVRHNVIRD